MCVSMLLFQRVCRGKAFHHLNPFQKVSYFVSDVNVRLEVPSENVFNGGNGLWAEYAQTCTCQRILGRVATLRHICFGYGSDGSKRNHKGSSDSEIVEHYSNLSSHIKKARNDVKCRIANGFFLSKQFAIEEDYKESIKESYNAKVKALNFDKADKAAKIIDGIISKKTEGRIKDMVNEDMVHTPLLSMPSTYFTAEWQEKFYKSANSNKTFHSIAGDKRKIEFMNEFEERRLYAEDDDFQVLSLPYSDTSFAFNIFLSKKRITIPKMKIETDFKLKEALIVMKVSEMFTDNADLSGITKEAPLKISDAAHRAIIDVNEEGTTATAATLFKAIPLSAVMAEPVKFRANHPFLFILTKDNHPLFMGQFV